jgi:uncharacterized protein YgbK (DUF1537 family)
MCGAPTEWPSNVEVLSLDLDLRERSDTTARLTIESAARQLGSAARVFVKIDSTLRGPISGLVAGALNGSATCLAVVAPAFPEQGRLVRHGRLFVDGQPGPSVADVLGTPAETVVVDVETTEDLRHVAEAALSHRDWLLVGSAGLARALAGPAEPRIRAPHSDGPLLVVAGTPAAATRAQLQRLEAVEDVVTMSTTPADGRDLGEAAAALADRVAVWAEHHAPRAVVLTGGATARAVCDRLGVRALRIQGELAPGIPIGRLEDGVWHGVTVVTKAGGFGGPKTLRDVARALS